MPVKRGGSGTRSFILITWRLEIKGPICLRTSVLLSRVELSEQETVFLINIWINICSVCKSVKCFNRRITARASAVLKAIRNVVRGTIFIAAGLCFLGFMLFFGLFAFEFLTGGAGIEFVGFSVTPGGALVGMIPFVGFVVSAFICFLIGVTLCAYGVVPPDQEQRSRENKPLPLR